MSKVVNYIFQGGGSFIQIANQLGWLVPKKYEPHIAMSVGLIQAVVGVLAHYYNPDGTPAEQAWNK